MSIIARTRYATQTLPYYGEKDLVSDDHTTGDIIEEIQAGHDDYKGEYDQVADEFWTGDVPGTAERLYNVLKRHVVYNVEHEDNQCVKSPGAIIHDGHGDCKHYASFTNGVADALARQGKPVTCLYRFVSDSPGQKVHHVFAVLKDKNGQEYWVDPVLNSFNAQPKFYETKDLPMSLYRVSGTVLDSRPANLPTVGNVFKDIAHSISVNAHNAGNAVTKVVHDAGHGVSVDAQNLAKGAQQAGQKVEHVALNVGLAPARNAFMALLDMNAFNLATRMSDAWTAHHDDVANEWKKLGGDENRLLAAINNGRKHKAFYHNQAPATKLSGDFRDFISGWTEHRQQPQGGMQVMEVPTLLQAYYIGPNQAGRMPVVAGIGEPVSIATLTALAGALIAVFSKWMKPDKGDQNAQQAAQAGVASIITNASDAIDAGQTAAGAQMMNVANAGAQAINTMQIAAGVGPDGVPTVAVTDFQHPQLTNAGTTTTTAQNTSYQDPNNLPAPRGQGYDTGAPQTPADNLTDKVTALPGKLTGDVGEWIKANIIEPAKKIWADYKTPIVFVIVGVGVYKISTHKKKRRR